MKTRISTTLVLGAVLLAAGTVPRMAQAAEFDTAMAPILVEYLKIHTALAADTTEGVNDAVDAIEDLAKKLDPETAAEDHAAHYGNVPRDILAGCAALREAKDIGSAREAFKELSRPISMWVTMAKPSGNSVMYCSMAKAGWVQRGAEVKNPYYGAQMLGCGQKVGGSK